VTAIRVVPARYGYPSRTCEDCGREFPSASWHRRRCNECAREHRNARRRVRHEPRACIECGEEFVPRRAGREVLPRPLSDAPVEAEIVRSQPIPSRWAATFAESSRHLPLIFTTGARADRPCSVTITVVGPRTGRPPKIWEPSVDSPDTFASLSNASSARIEVKPHIARGGHRERKNSATLVLQSAETTMCRRAFGVKRSQAAWPLLSASAFRNPVTAAMGEDAPALPLPPQPAARAVRATTAATPLRTRRSSQRRSGFAAPPRGGVGS